MKLRRDWTLTYLHDYHQDNWRMGSKVITFSQFNIRAFISSTLNLRGLWFLDSFFYWQFSLSAFSCVLNKFSLQSKRNFGEQELSIPITKIMAIIFDFNGSGRLERERNLFPGGGRRSKIRRVGVSKWRLRLPEVILILKKNYFCPRTEFLIGAVKLQLSVISKMRH